MDVALRLVALALLVPTAAAQTWEDVSPPGGAFDRVQEVEVDPADPLHVVALKFGELFETFDGGQAWSSLDVSGLPGPPTSVTLTIDDDLFVGVSRDVVLGPGGGLPLVFRRAGTTWAPFGPDVNRPSPSAAAGWEAVRFLVGRGDSELMVLATQEGRHFVYGGAVQYFLSDDGGASWTLTSLPMTGEVLDLEILERAQGAGLVASQAFHPSTGTESYLYRSATWSAPVDFVDFEYGRHSLSASRVETGRLYRAVTSFDSNTPLGLERSDDVGATWTAIGAPGYFWSPRFGAVDPDLRLRSVTNSQLSAVRIEISNDDGATWQPLADPPLAGGVSTSAWELELAHDDSRVYAWSGTSEIFALDLVAATGAPECSAQPNATGRGATIRTHGARSIAADDLRVHVDSVPPGTSTLLLASRNTGFVVGPGGSFGDLCLGGAIGRFGVTTALPTGEAFFDVPVGGLPTPTGPVAAQAGETWRFQVWFRDVQGGQLGSNFSDAVALTFEP